MNTIESIITKHVGNVVEHGRKSFCPEEETKKDLQAIRFGVKDNLKCYDCSGTNPSWLSSTYGIFLCLVCSGQHRQKGSHLSFVRSTTLDKLEYSLILRMAVGGNGRCRTFLRNTSNREGKLDVYSQAAKDYKNELDRAVAELLGEDLSQIPTLAPVPAPVKDLPSESAPVPLCAPESVVSDSSPLVSPVSSPPPIRPMIAKPKAGGSAKRKIPMAKSAAAGVVANAPGKLSTSKPIQPRGSSPAVRQPYVPPNGGAAAISSADYFVDKPAEPASLAEPAVPARQPYKPPNGGAAAISSADLFGDNHTRGGGPTGYGGTRSGYTASGVTGLDMDEILLGSQVIADNAKDKAFKIANEGSELLAKATNWFGSYMQQP